MFVVSGMEGKGEGVWIGDVYFEDFGCDNYIYISTEILLYDSGSSIQYLHGYI